MQWINIDKKNNKCMHFYPATEAGSGIKGHAKTVMSVLFDSVGQIKKISLMTRME